MKYLIVLIFSFSLISCTAHVNDTTPANISQGSTILANSCKNAQNGGNINLANPTSGINVLPVSLDGNYPNAPMTSVKICEPGTTNCLVIDNLLVDTGSFGLRIFKNALTGLNLPQINTPTSLALAECAQFGIGSTWGPIKNADVILGEESAVSIPIQIIDSTFASRPVACANSDTDPASAGYNGILGVGLFKEDCGNSCTSNNPPADLYYACNGLTCVTSNAPLASQVTNPVAKLPIDFNGVILELPSINNCGVQTVMGTLTLGLDTRSNNSTAKATSYFATNSFGEFTTVFNGHNYSQSFIDSGSNGLFFPKISSLPNCTQPVQGSDISTFYCPNETVTLSATQTSGATQKNILFKINNAYNLFLSPNFNFNDIAATLNNGFDWGLPFFYGKKVIVGIEGKSSSIGTGPFWAF